MLPAHRLPLWYGGIFVIGALDFWWRGSIGQIGNVCNPGIAWGIALSVTVILAVNLGALIFFAWLFWRERDAYRRLVWVLIIVGGGINFADRLIAGCVRDYLHFPGFPSFNLADMMLCLGIALSLLWASRRPREL